MTSSDSHDAGAPGPTDNGFAGWLRLPGASASRPADLSDRIARVARSLDRPTLIDSDNLVLASSLAIGAGKDSPDSAAEGPVLAIAGQARWADDGSEPNDRTDLNAALLRAYQSHGSLPAERLHGHFALAMIDPQAGQLLLITDRMTRVPLYYYQGDSGIYFGTSARAVRDLCGQAPDIDPQGLYNYVYFHMIPAPGTVYRDMVKLRNATEVRIKGDTASERRYWTPAFREHCGRPQADMHSDLRQLLKSAVRQCLPAEGSTGAFLSGGLDSSTVAGMLSEVQDGPAQAYAIGFDAEGYDEMAYARITAEHFGIKLNEYYVTPQDVLDALPAIAAGADEPFGNSSALPAWFCARMAAKDGVNTLLAGDGGDELFAGNERYAKDKAFQVFQRLPGWFRSRLLEPLVLSLPGAIPLQGKARSYIQQARVPLPDRLQAYNFLHRNDPASVFTPSFLDAVSTEYPLQLLRETFQAPADAGDLNRMLHLDWQITLADNDLRKVNRACEMAGVAVRYPMLDDALADFSTRLPSRWKLPGRTLRDFYKQALAGWLPQATLDKEKHGFGLPFGVWMRSYAPLSEMAYDCVSRLKSRDIFTHEFLDRAIDLHRSDHAAYFGSLIWILTALELWLDANA